MQYIYGPVKSRRIGFSLGISLTPKKICSFDCIYCQVGRTSRKTTERQEYLKAQDVIEELKAWLQNNPAEAEKLDYITLSGTGEPTLNLKLEEIIAQIKALTRVRLAVITNASLLGEASVRRALLAADLLVPSLDAATSEVMAKIDRPQEGIAAEEIINGLVALRQEYRGKIWLEVMLVKGVNDDLRQIRKLKEAIERINPDKIQINSPVRSTAEPGVLAVAKSKLRKIKEILGDKAEIV